MEEEQSSPIWVNGRDQTEIGIKVTASRVSYDICVLKRI